MLDINELLDDIRKIRNDLVAQSSPHFQSLTNIIYKWEMKLLEENSENKIRRFDNKEEDAS